MPEPIKGEVMYHYDFYPTEEDLMGEAPPHAKLVHYLMEVLAWLFRGQVCSLHENYNFYRTDNEYERPLVPDIAVIKSVAEQSSRSWRVGVHGPAPHVVFEIASEETWKRDLQEKPDEYATLGVQEYYAYDPCEPALYLSRLKGHRLFGWQRDRITGLLYERTVGPNGSLWSPQLESFLVPDGRYLRLTDRSGQLRLTGLEAEAEARRAETRRANIEAEAHRAETLRAEEALQLARALAEKLRSIGIDPDRLV